MSSPTIYEPTAPGFHYASAIGGALVSSVFSYATYSSQHSTVFKVSFIVGTVFSLLVQTALYASKDIESKDFWKSSPTLIFGYLSPAYCVYRLTVMKFFPVIASKSWNSDDSAYFGGMALGYAATNVLFESYHYYRSRQTEQ